MSWIPFLVVLLLAIGYVYMKRAGQVSAKDAYEYFKKGAMVIDVRSTDEFNSGHLLQAYNMPLDRVDILVPGAVKDKSKYLLLHCASGVRSRMAQKKLEDIGYKNVFNLGSYERAEKIVKGSQR